MVEGASTVEVVVNDRDTFDAEVWGVDPENDIALLRICCGAFEALEWADPSDTSEGNQAIAMGYPLGLPGKATVTNGIISAERFDSGQWVIQTDAAINPGNSGGPLISSKGKVLGINTWKYSSSSDGRPVEGLGFAVSLKTIQPVLEDLKSGYMKPVPTPTPTPTPTPLPPPPASGQGTLYIPDISATVEGLRFYEAPAGGVPKDDRQYLRFFDGSNVRYLVFEMTIFYPFQPVSQSFDIEWVYYRNGVYDSGSVTSESTLQGYTGSIHAIGWGNDLPGSWLPGDYVLELFSEGVLIATGEVGIY